MPRSPSNHRAYVSLFALMITALLLSYAGAQYRYTLLHIKGSQLEWAPFEKEACLTGAIPETRHNQNLGKGEFNFGEHVFQYDWRAKRADRLSLNQIQVIFPHQPHWPKLLETEVVGDGIKIKIQGY